MEDASPPLPTCKLHNLMTSTDWITEASFLLKEPMVPDSVKHDVSRLWLPSGGDRHSS